MVTELIYQETVQAIATGTLLSVPRCTVCADAESAVCHCRPGFAWFSLDEQPEVAERSDTLIPGRVTAPAPVHRQDASVVTSAVDAGDAATQVMPAVTEPRAQRSA